MVKFEFCRKTCQEMIVPRKHFGYSKKFDFFQYFTRTLDFIHSVFLQSMNTLKFFTVDPLKRLKSDQYTF